jgi:hypothetical protein
VPLATRSGQYAVAWQGASPTDWVPVKLFLVRALATLDEAVDAVLYRPAVVEVFSWLPRWWMCDLAKVSMWLDDGWATRWWERAIEPDGPCQACGRRAAIHVYGGIEPDEEPVGDYLEDHPVVLCGWCTLGSPVTDEAMFDESWSRLGHGQSRGGGDCEKRQICRSRAASFCAARPAGRRTLGSVPICARSGAHGRESSGWPSVAFRVCSTALRL